MRSILWLLLPLSSSALVIGPLPSPETARILAKGLCGAFHNEEQARVDKNFKKVWTWYRPMLRNSENAWPIYQESALEETLDNPYRQSVVFVVFDKGLLKLHSHKLKKDKLQLFRGSARNGGDLLEGLHFADLEQRTESCDMIVDIVQQDDDFIFAGRLESSKDCRFSKAGCETFLDANFELRAQGAAENYSGAVKHYKTEDRFVDVVTEKQVWGSEHGPYVFSKSAIWSPDPFTQ